MRRGPFVKPISMNFSLSGPSKARQRTSRASWTLIFNDIRRSALWKAVEEHIDLPSRSISVDELDHSINVVCFPARQQAPHLRLYARWHSNFLRQLAGNSGPARPW